jgi:hypothetical protein
MTDPRRWVIRPGEGIGPLLLGTPRQQVRDAMAELAGPPPTQFEREADRPIDHFGELGVQVHYEDDRCVGIEVAEPIQAVLTDEPLVGRPFVEAAAVVRSLDPAAEPGPDGVTSVALGLALYAPAAGKAPDEPVEGVLVTTADRLLPAPEATVATGAVAVLRPDVGFAAVDAAVHAAGLEGGPTTALPPLLPGEPELAEWTDPAHPDVRVSYSFDPTVMLRVLEVGVPADHETWLRLSRQLPTVPEEDLLAGLFAGDVETLARTVLAARVLTRRDLLPRIEQLRRHSSGVVAAVADRTVRDLRS